MFSPAFEMRKIGFGEVVSQHALEDLTIVVSLAFHVNNVLFLFVHRFCGVFPFVFTECFDVGFTLVT